MLFSREPLEDDDVAPRGYISTLGLERDAAAVCSCSTERLPPPPPPLPPPPLLATGRPWALPWAGGGLPEAEEGRPEEEEEEAAGEGEAVGWPAGRLFLAGSLQWVGGRVRGLRVSEGNGGHSLPSRTGGGPVRLPEDEDEEEELSPEVPRVVVGLRAHLGASVELPLVMRWATVWCIHSTSG